MNDAASRIRENAVKFSRSRGNLLAVVIFTLVNMGLVVFGSDWYLLFSATVPYLLIIFAVEEAAIFGYNAITITLIAMALIGVFLYFLFWLLSGRFRAFMLVAMIFFSIDSIVLLVLMLNLFLVGAFDFGLLLDAAFQTWIMFYLITGTVAWARLRGVTREQLQDVKNTVDNEMASSALNQMAENTNENANSEENSDNDTDNREV